MSTQQGNKKGRDKLKTYFETGDRPTEDEFSQLIDSGINQEDDQVYVKDRATSNPKLGLGVEEPNEKLHVNGSIQVEDNIKGKDSRTGHLRISSAQNDDQDGSCMYMMRSDDGGSNSGGITFVAAGDGVKNGFEFTHKNQLSGQFEQSVRISGNGDVGIGTNAPNAKLVIQDDYQGPHGGAIRIEGPNGETGSNLRLGAHQDYSWIQSHYNKPLYLNKSGNNTILNPVFGTVGIGTNSPDNTARLHVHNGAGGKGVHTGLRLSTNAGNKKVLTSDPDGNAFWEDRENITNGLWRKGDDTNDIVNGNSQNVGIGTNAPAEKLTVNGDIGLDRTGKLLFRTNDPNHGLGWFGHDWVGNLQKFFGGESINGPVLYGYNGGALGSMRENDASGEQKIALKWDRLGRVGINGLGGAQHWGQKLQIWGDKKVPLLLETKTNDAIHFHDDDDMQKVRNRAPFTFVDTKGERGFRFYSAGSRNHETLRVDGNGSVKLNGLTPFVLRKFSFSLSDNLHLGVNLKEIVNGSSQNISVSKYGAVIVGGFYTDEAHLPKDIDGSKFHIKVNTYLSGGYWKLKADFSSNQIKAWGNVVDDHEIWTVYLLFISSQISQSYI